MADDMLGSQITGAEGLLTNLNALAGLENSPELREALQTGAAAVVTRARENLDRMVYAKPAAGFERRRDAGLYGATKALENYRTKSDKVITTVGTFDYRAPFVQFGTGAEGKAKGGRRTAWTYKDERGNWRTTVGHAPVPYLTEALAATRDEFMANLMHAIECIPKQK